MGTRPADPDDPDSIGPLRTIGLLTVASLIAAIGIGFLGGAFRWLLQEASALLGDLVAWSHRTGGSAWLVPIALAAVGALVGRLVVTLNPRSAGSGIQDVEAVWRRQAELPSLSVVPIKFVGGLASMGAGGLVLGREGPTVHMGSVIGSTVGSWLRLGEPDRRLLYATVGGAGLAVAFNAPLGGALFVLEEVTRSIKIRITLVTIFCTSLAVACSRMITGDQPDFAVGPVSTPPLGSLGLFVVFGALTGLLGVGYNRLVVGLLVATDRMRRVGPVARAGLIGAVIGVLSVIDPLTVGGGDQLTQQLLSGQPFALGAAVGYLVIRFLVGPLSYAAGTPGGLFAPLLAVGALWGTVFHGVASTVLPGIATAAVPLAVVGMAAFFAATVRAPVTGIVLIIEMTATTSLAVPMLAACAAATLVAYLVHGPPVYDTLRERMLRTAPPGDRRRAA